jgi:hypothetical protein
VPALVGCVNAICNVIQMADWHLVVFVKECRWCAARGECCTAAAAWAAELVSGCSTEGLVSCWQW